MAKREDPDYEVGYGRPPEGTRFQPGQSGNPKGRPKGAQNFASLLSTELNELVPVNEGGRRRRITKRAAIIKQLVNSAAKGDPRALQALLRMDVDVAEPNTKLAQPLTSAEHEMVKAFLGRQQSNEQDAGDGHE